MSRTTPYPASSLSFAHRHASRAQQPALLALYALHQKWRETAVYPDPHHAVTTLNWWHHEIEKAKTGEINHPNLITLKPYGVFDELLALLHGHMHWHHLVRVDTLEQLQPTIDAIGGSYVRVWLGIVKQPNDELALHAGRALWWIDQTRHIGHNLAPSRMWLPMSWLKELNLPVHLLLNRKLSPTERAQHAAPLTHKLIATAQTALNAYQAHTVNAPKSLRALVNNRTLLLNEITLQPHELWQGLISVSPRRKWWAALWA
ncbi:MAG: squalene/phytoene synthase family protein [Formosimonas sp.]